MLRAVSRTAVRSLPPRLPSISRCRIDPLPARPFSSHHHGPRGAHTPHHKPSHTLGPHSTPPTTPSPVSTPLSSTPSSLPPPNTGAPPFTTPPLQPSAPPPPPAGPTPPPASAGGEQHHTPPHKRIARRIIPALVAAAKLMFRKALVLAALLVATILVVVINPLLEGDAWKQNQEKSLLHNPLPINRFEEQEDEWRKSAADALHELLTLPPCRLIFISAPHNAGKSSFVLSVLKDFDAVAYLNLSKYGSCNSIDDLVQLLTEQFNIWSGPKVGKDIRNVVELIGLPRETAEPRVFNRRELSSLLSTIEGILDFYIASHPNAPLPIFFADDAQALKGLLFAGHFQTKEGDSGRERRDSHEALRDFFAWAAAMSKAGKCHFIVASTPSFFFQALSSGAIYDDYIIPIELPELEKDDAVHYLVEHGVKREKALHLINKSGALLGTLDALSVLSNTGLGRLGFSNARYFELVDSAFEPESIQYRPDPQFAEEMKPRWTPGQWLTVLEELTSSPDGAVSMVRLLNREGMTREALRSLIEHNLVMYRVTLPTRRAERGPFVAASHSGLLNAMKEYNKSYLPAKGVLHLLLCEEQARSAASASKDSAAATAAAPLQHATTARDACKQVNVHAPLSVEEVAAEVGAKSLSHEGKLLSRNSHLVPLRNGDVVYFSRSAPTALHDLRATDGYPAA